MVHGFRNASQALKNLAIHFLQEGKGKLLVAKYVLLDSRLTGKTKSGTEVALLASLVSDPHPALGFFRTFLPPLCTGLAVPTAASKAMDLMASRHVQASQNRNEEVGVHLGLQW